MNVVQSRSFARKGKKLNYKEKRALDDAVTAIITTPCMGTEKKGDLKGVFVYKFKLITTEYLLSYRIVGEDLELITLGPHENYYRDPKSNLKNR
jgi:hypothetical protein